VADRANWPLFATGFWWQGVVADAFESGLTSSDRPDVLFGCVC
jgi:hypothetical protein